MIQPPEIRLEKQKCNTIKYGRMREITSRIIEAVCSIVEKKNVGEEKFINCCVALHCITIPVWTSI
jgi:hypothetical protein